MSSTDEQSSPRPTLTNANGRTMNARIPTPPAIRRDALAAAEQFLAATAEAVHPDLSGAALLSYAARYRAHLAAVIAACR
ncbi:MAG TPA: hypothetical protein VMV92_19140 [Streptosporangiaceae bacterium]|nr:hypothetical protein [Streptosporangiaceae bacterium]